MEAVFVGALLNPLLPFILGVLRERHQLRQGIEKDITFIKDELPMIAAAIEQHQSADVKSEEVRGKLIEQLRELAHDMELCIGLFVHARARKRLRVQQLKKLKIRFRARSGPMGSRTQFARSLQELKERSKEVKARAEDNMATGSQSAPSLPREPDEPELRLMADTVGMDAALDHVLQFVHPPVDPKEEEKKHRVICIVGPAGVGKTLLANRAYNCMIDCVPLFSPHICVRAADMAKEDLFLAILRDIGIDDTARFKTDKLRDHLHGKRYLIVIDDLQNTEQWECIKSCFPVDRRVCSRVIVTTTSQSVADACRSPNGYVYKMRSLNESDSTSLFIREAYLEEHRDVVADVSAAVRRKCDGLPLALVSIARFVREKGGLDSCEGICRELGSYLHRERTLARMNWVLQSKYNSLDGPAVKACLLYFSTLDCAQPILRDSTVRRWVSEGFVDPYPRRNCTLLNEQYNNWETLIDRNIIKPTVVGYNGKVKACQPAGMVLEYISYKSMVQKFVAFHDQIPPPKHTRWLSLHNCRGSFSDLGESHPRTLTISGPAGEAVLSFANSELMQVLDLEQCTDVEDCHMDKICNLFLLRYLSLGAKISKVPRKIKNLGWLETLDLRNTRIRVIPKEVILIPHLTHLLGRFQLFEGDYSRSESKLKEFMQNKSKLETLAGFIIGTNLGFPQLMHLMRQLRKVKIICSSDADPTNLVDLTAALRKFLSDGTGMSSPGDRSLSIDFHECSTNFRNSECFQNFIESLRNVSGSLHSLKLSGLGEQLSQTISFVRNIGGIMELYLSSTTLNWNSVIKDGVINFRRLRYLKLVADEIQGDAITISPNQLRGLKRLCLVVKGRLPQIMILDGALQYLVSLHLICKTLDGSPNFTIKHLTMLKEVALHSEVTPETKYVWNEAARRHPNKPSVLFIDYPRHAQQMTQPIPPNLASSAIANAPGIHSNAPLVRVGSQIAATTAATN